MATTGAITDYWHSYSIADIVSDVRVILDYNRVDTPLVTAGETAGLDVDDLIEGNIVTAARDVMLEAPTELLGSGSSFSTNNAYSYGTDLGGYVILPHDFLRLLSFKMSDWRYAVHEALPATSPEYAQQGSKHAGIRGNYQRPTCFLRPHSNGLRLDYSVSSGTISEPQYVPYPYISGNNISLPPRLLHGIEYMCGALCCLSVGDADRYQAMKATARDLCKIKD